MADVMLEQKRYLEARLRECESNPGLNKNQIAEYQKYLALLASCKDANEYADRIAFSGDMVSISQAEQIDRYENLQRIRRLFGDENAARAEQIRIDAARSATSHLDLNNRLTAAAGEADAIVQKARQAVNAVSVLFACLVTYKTCASSRKTERKNAVISAWNDLRTADPGITWEKVLSYKPYRSILFFDNPRLEAFGNLLAEALK